MNCFNCGKEIEKKDVIGRGDSCASCNADVRCCKNCEFYDAKVYNECNETQAERVVEKERSNFCGFFQASSRMPGGVAKKVDDLKAKANALFKK